MMTLEIINMYKTMIAAKNTVIPPIPLMNPQMFAKNIDVIPTPNMVGICISATEISTFENPPYNNDSDCKLGKPNTLENICERYITLHLLDIVCLK